MVKIFDSIKGKISQKEKANKKFSSENEIAGTYRPKEFLEGKDDINAQDASADDKKKKK
jgi:hypothetical protein